MKKSIVPGTRGYETVVEAFTQASTSLTFEQVNQDFLPYLPPEGAHILDAGAGIGQNAASLAQRGYKVVAVEPMPEFLKIGQARYPHKNITWFNGALPKLEVLGNAEGEFDFILVDGVWHHLEEQERSVALSRFSKLLQQGGRCALSLRNGPAGAGKHVFPTDSAELTQMAACHGLKTVFVIEGQASLLPNKPNVIWTRQVLQKT